MVNKRIEIDEETEEMMKGYSVVERAEIIKEAFARMERPSVRRKKENTAQRVIEIINEIQSEMTSCDEVFRLTEPYRISDKWMNERHTEISEWRDKLKEATEIMDNTTAELEDEKEEYQRSKRRIPKIADNMQRCINQLRNRPFTSFTGESKYNTELDIIFYSFSEWRERALALAEITPKQAINTLYNPSIVKTLIEEEDIEDTEFLPRKTLNKTAWAENRDILDKWLTKLFKARIKREMAKEPEEEPEEEQ